MKCASAGPCVVFMPRIDLWAMEINHQVPEESDSCSKHHQFPDLDVQKESESDKKKFKSAEMTDQQCAGRSASHAWSSFIEQAESLCVSTSLMILVWYFLPAPQPQIFPEVMCLWLNLQVYYFECSLDNAL